MIVSLDASILTPDSKGLARGIPSVHFLAQSTSTADNWRF
jgi:hypothetical protein